MTIREKLKAECERIIAERDKWKKEFTERLAKDVFGVFKWRAEVYLFSEYNAEIAGQWLEGIENIKEDAKLESHIRAILARDIQHLLREGQNRPGDGMSACMFDIENEAKRKWVESLCEVLGDTEFIFSTPIGLCVTSKD